MTARVVPAATVPALVIPPGTGQRARSTSLRPAPPLPSVPTGSPASVGGTYAFVKIDHVGRVAHAGVERVLGWQPGARLSIRHVGGMIIVAPDEYGVFSLSTQGHVSLPVPVRRMCRLSPGDQVMLAVEVDADRLVIWPMASLNTLLAAELAAVLGGDR